MEEATAVGTLGRIDFRSSKITLEDLIDALLFMEPINESLAVAVVRHLLISSYLERVPSLHLTLCPHCKQNTCRLRLDSPKASLDSLGPWAVLLSSDGQNPVWWSTRLPENITSAIEIVASGTLQTCQSLLQHAEGGPKGLATVVWIAPSMSSLQTRYAVLTYALRVLQPGGLLLVAEGGGDVVDGDMMGEDDTNSEDNDDDLSHNVGVLVPAEASIARVSLCGDSQTQIAAHATNHLKFLLIAHDISVAKIVRDTSQNDDHNLCDPLIGESRLIVRRRYISESGAAWCVVSEKENALGNEVTDTVPETPKPLLLLPPTPPDTMKKNSTALSSLSFRTQIKSSVSSRRQQRVLEAIAAMTARDAMVDHRQLRSREGERSTFPPGIEEGQSISDELQSRVHVSIGEKTKTGVTSQPVEGSDLLPLPSFHDWRDTYPELRMLLDNFDMVAEDAARVSQLGPDAWKEWPEEHYSDGGNQDWKIFPFAHTFPANDESRRHFIASTCEVCPNTGM